MKLACKHMQGMNFIVRLVHLAHRLERTADRCFFGPHGLTMSTGRILLCLYHVKQKTPTELTEMIGGKKSNITQRIALLRKAGLVELAESVEGDRRRVMISLTQKGEETAKKMEEIFKTHIQEFENGMSEEQKLTMNSVLNLIDGKLDSVECKHV